ncbi:MAG: 50S ribosomal protein L18 [Halobacteriovoraceae bacterium]|nr:50S ribosomal protein L18 [Halobacteriovoraceae bacterium]
MRKPIGKIKNESLVKRVRRKLSIRKKVSGQTDRPRICINKTNKHIIAQVIDDNESKTLFSVSTFGKNSVPSAKGNVEGAKLLGKKLAEDLKNAKIEKAVFDRNGYKYTGIIAALANSVRENGINI